MHPAYINNRRTVFFLSLSAWCLFSLSFPFSPKPPTSLHYMHLSLCLAGHLWKFRETFRTWSRSLSLPFFSYGRPEKSVNILPCIHVANSLTLEELTVYPLKNACDISSERSSLTRYEVKEGRERRWKRGGSFSKLYVKPTYTAQRDDCFAKEIAFFRTHVGLPIDNTFSPERKKRERASKWTRERVEWEGSKGRRDREIYLLQFRDRN